jgi:glycine cleavage system protein P-like pyridoxal-binding family
MLLPSLIRARPRAGARDGRRRSRSTTAPLPEGLRREDDLDGCLRSASSTCCATVRLSQWNYSAATTMYPLGSCTMKYNPVVNEEMARLPGFAGLHPSAGARPRARSSRVA